QRTAVLRSPSSASVAVAARSTGFPVMSEVPLVGAAIDTAGATFGGRTMTVRCARPVSPPRSVAEAVMRCVPALRRVVAKLAPEPMSPSRSELHGRDVGVADADAHLRLAVERVAVGRPGGDDVRAGGERGRADGRAGAEGAVAARRPLDLARDVAVPGVAGGCGEGDRVVAEADRAVGRRAD